MFSEACNKIRESVYGIIGRTIINQNGPQQTINFSNGTGFMVAPGFILTAGHMVHINNDPKQPIQQKFEVIRAPDIGQKMEIAVFVAEDKQKDLALLKIENPRNKIAVKIHDKSMPRGENCGFLGFPLATIDFLPNGSRQFNLSERFQGAYISNYLEMSDPVLGTRKFYEIDTLMYAGSSGCPGFTIKGEIFGMQVASMMQKNKEDEREERVAISLVVPAIDITEFLKTQKVLAAEVML
jgi:hypothetical protein